MSEIGWMPGVFRQRKHWVSVLTRNFEHEYGTTYYAECGAPCLDAIDLKRLWWNWDTCAICAATTHPGVEWWLGPLQATVVHARTTDVLALCGALVVTEVADMARRHDLSACRHCVADLSA